MPRYKVTNPATGQVVTLEGATPPTDADLDEIFSSMPQQSKYDINQQQPTDLRQSLANNPITATAAEAGAGVSRGIAQTADFFTTKPIRAIQQLAGVAKEDRLTTLEDTFSGTTQGNFMNEGLGRDVVRAGSELVAPSAVGGAVLRTAAKAMPATLEMTTGQGVMKQLGASTAAQDIAGGALSGAGGELGEEVGGDTGKLVASFLTPMAGMAAAPVLTKALTNPKQAVGFIKGIMNPLSKMSDEGASILLQEAMIREGLSPDDIIKKLAVLGKEGMPADLGNNFARLLKTAANRVDLTEGKAALALKARHEGQSNRVMSSLDDGTGLSMLTLDDELLRLDNVMKPQIKELYNATRQQDMELSPKLMQLFEGNGSLGKAFKKAQTTLIDRSDVGDELKNIDIIDAVKQTLDDQINVAIRKGAGGKARDLIRAKNLMVNEADTAIPVYKEARNLYGGKVALENAGKAGTNFLKMNNRDLTALTSSMGESERRIFKMGAKQAIVDKLDDLRTNANIVDRVFGKNGDADKLRHLFDDDKAFLNFKDTLEKETQFVLTRRAAQANSTTAKQLFDDDNAFSTLTSIAGDIGSASGAKNIFNKIVSGFTGKKSDAAYTKALEDAGDILLIKGIDPDKIRRLLTQGSPISIQKRIEQALNRPTLKIYTPTGATVTAFGDNQ